MNSISSEPNKQCIALRIRMSKELIDRIENHCQKHKITIDDFLLDAVTAKLQMANIERRKRQRL